MAGELRLGVFGAAGRLGSRIIQLASERSDVKVALAVVSAGSAKLGESVPGVAYLRYARTGDDVSACDVLIDVSAAGAAKAHVSHAVQAGKPLLMATTGLPSDARA